MGTKAVGRGAAHFDDVRVPAENVLGEEGRVSPRSCRASTSAGR